MDLKKRLDQVVQKDKLNNPQFLINVIKSDFYYLINNYFEVDFKDINIEIALENDKYLIDINCLGDRIKLVKVLP
jgi:septum formation topological specificity factor MinE